MIFSKNTLSAIKGLITLWLAISLSGCATPYGSSSGNFLGGFSETQLGENMFKVVFKGNAMIGADTVANYTLLRSAELTLLNGFTHFIVIDKADLSEKGTYTTPTTSSTTGSASIVGNTLLGSSTTQYYGGQTYTYKKPGASNTIVCFKGKPQVDGFVYSAEFLVKSLRARYRLPPSSTLPSSSRLPSSLSNDSLSSSDTDIGISELKVKLRQLKELVNDGLITQDDYESKKATLINQID